MIRSKLTENELEVLKKIRGGRTEFLKEKDSDVNSDLFHSINFLQSVFGFVTYEFSSEKKGIVNAKITDKGLYYLDPEQLKRDIDEKFRNLFGESE